MSGEHQKNNDDDFLDDFVLDEGVVEGEATPPHDRAKAPADGAFEELDEDLDQNLDEELALDEPSSGTISFDGPEFDAAATASEPVKPGEPDAEDLLFEDHTQGLESSVEFDPKGQFDEAGLNEWDGGTLDLDEDPAVSEFGVPIDDDAGTPVELGVDGDAVSAAEEAFGEELNSLLQEPDEFVLESDQELELVDAEQEGEAEVIDSVAAVGGDAFIIDDSAAEGDWQEAELAAPDAVVEYGQELADIGGGDGADGWQEIELAKAAPANDSEEVDGDIADSDYFSNVSGTAADDGGGEVEGWEPLPGTSMDQLAEVEGVAPVGYDDGEAAYESESEHYGEPALAAVGRHEDHDDIYAEGDDEAEVIGGYRSSHRMFGMLTAVAAVVVMGLGGFIAVYRPEWFGLRFEPDRVEIVHVSRPFVAVDVAPPPLPGGPGASEQPLVVVVEPPVVEVDPVTGNPPSNDPPVVVTGPPVVDPLDPTPPVATGPVTSDPGVVTVPSRGPGDPGWPIAVGNGTPAPQSDSAEVPELMRVGSDLLVGQAAELPARLTAGGVMPGSRAFAQLGNGNYFIGNVKAVDAKFITLRLANGEISLARDSIVRLTGLGSADYDDLQKATSGFVRLTNNNRLVGSILESIADDHIILQTRSNRVMLPRADIGEIIHTGGSTDVRLGTTSEEDDWLRRMSERQLESANPRATAPRPDGGRGN